jgi:hypothetical protein
MRSNYGVQAMAFDRGNLKKEIKTETPLYLSQIRNKNISGQNRLRCRKRIARMLREKFIALESPCVKNV